MVANENNELIPTRVTSDWRVCIDYRKLNAGTRKITSLYLLSIKRWRELQGMNSIVFSMGTWGTTKLR